MSDQPRPIEHAFPLKQASLTSVPASYARHGGVVSMPVWPVRGLGCPMVGAGRYMKARPKRQTAANNQQKALWNCG